MANSTKSQPEPTPGPWRVIDPGIEGMLEIWDGKTERSDTTVWLAIVSTTHGYTEANARLIAAAPDLLEALEHILPEYIGLAEQRYSSSGVKNWGRVKFAVAAIAKAREASDAA